MNDAPTSLAPAHRDRGTVLTLVLVLVVIGSLIVLPMLQYSVTVFRANRVVNDRAQAVEAAKGGLRVALGDPANVFVECNDGGNLPTIGVNGYTVSTTCSEVSEIGVSEALGGQVPYNAVALQIGQTIPNDFAFADGDAFTYAGPTPPYPVDPPAACPTAPDEFWWCDDIDYNTDPDVNGGAPTPLVDSIWLPDLPEYPTVERTTHYDMPAGFSCQVYLPGRYPNPIDITGGDVYFASGVYYFEDAVTISGDANVVVGYGLADFGSGCADDRQVTVNLLNPPPIYGISGAGATWVLGVNGRLVVDDSAGSPTVRFNQRYVEDGQAGGRISIMSVNGNVDGVSDHTVTHVNHVPRSQVLDGITPMPIATGTYEPSDVAYTDIAREPAQLANLDVTTYTDQFTGLGVAQIEWDDLAGNDLGGSLLGVREDDGTWSQTPYRVQMREQDPSTGSWQTICLPADIVVSSQGAGLPDRLRCTVENLDPASTHRFRVRAQSTDAYGTTFNASNLGETRPIDSTTASAPDAPTNVTIAPTDTVNSAQISWDEPSSDVVIDEYDVTVTAITQGPIANEAPIAFGTGTELDAGDVITLQLPVSDANGDSLTVSVDDSTLRNVDPTASATAIGSTVEIRTSTLTPIDTYLLPYTVSDGSGLVNATITVEVDAPPTMSVGDNLVLTLPSTPGPPSVTVDSTGLTAADPGAGVTITGLDVDVQTTNSTPPGLYDLAYTVTDGVDTLDGLLRILVEPDKIVSPGDAFRVKVRETEPAPPLAVPPYSLEVDATNSLTTADPGASVTVLTGDRIEIATTSATPYGSYTIAYRYTDVTGLLSWSVGSIAFTVDDPLPPPTPTPGTPEAYGTRALAAVGAPITVAAPVTHPDGDAMTITMTDLTPLTSVDPSASVVAVGLDVTISTVAPDGSYLLPFTATDGAGAQDYGQIEVVIDRTYTPSGSCTPPREDFVPLHLSCTISSLTPITTVPDGGLGYRFEVTATSKAGTSVAAVNAAPYPTSFDGSGSAFVGPSPLVRTVVPYVPEAIIDIFADGAGTATVSIAGYVSVPMGRIHVDNSAGDPVSMVGGVLAGTFDVVDGRADGSRNSVPIGYFNDIVLQRTVRITSIAGKRRSVAVVQVNEDGGLPGITSWFVD